MTHFWHIDLGGTMSDDEKTVTEKETVTEPADEPTDETVVTIETPKDTDEDDEG